KDQESLYILMNLEKFAQKERIQLTFKKLLIHIEDSRYKSELISFLEKVEHFSFPVEVINVYEEVAKRFWKQHHQIFEEEKDINLLIVGYDALGKQMAAEANKTHQKSRTKQSMTLTILDNFSDNELLNNIEKIPFHIE